jgi:peptidoglycan/LPS O-acetylase OafA/YrhL
MKKVKSLVISLILLLIISTKSLKSNGKTETGFQNNLIRSWFLKQSYIFDLFNVSSFNLTHDVITNYLESKSYASVHDEEDEDHPCEKKTSIMIKHFMDGTPLPPEYNDSYKFIMYSGTGLNDLGDYSSCKKMKIFNYYTIIFRIQFGVYNLSLGTGLCYFKECDIKYMNKAKSDIIQLLNRTQGINITEDQLSVVDPDSKNEDYRNRMRLGCIISVTILGLISLLPLIQSFMKIIPNKRASLIFDVDDERKSRKSFLENDHNVKTQEKSKLQTFFELFDFSKNVSKLLEIRHADPSLEALKVFDGVRFLSTCWVVFGHVFYYCLVAGIKNLSYIGIFSKSVKICFIFSALYAVDVFFFMSGFMLCFGLHRLFNSQINKLKIISMAIINRYIRLLPLYSFKILMMTYISAFLGNGPTFYKSEFLNSACQKYWWNNLLYLNNLLTYDNGITCAGHSWYLANDMQFFILSLFITIIFNKMNVVRNMIFVSIFVASSGYQIFETYTDNYRFNDLNHPSKGQVHFFDGYYNKPWNRICPYLLGIFFCELFIKTEVHLRCHKDKNLPSSESNKKGPIERFNRFLMSSNVAYALIFVFSLILINYAFFISYFTNNYDIPEVWHALFLTFNKVIFVFGLGCIIHLTFLGKLVFIKEFLSFKIFSFFAKFTYGTYLIHFYILNIFFFSFNELLFFNFSDLVFMSIGVTLISIVLSFFLTILLESPVVNATKLLLYGDERKHKH